MELPHNTVVPCISSTQRADDPADKKAMHPRFGDRLLQVEVRPLLCSNTTMKLQQPGPEVRHSVKRLAYTMHTHGRRVCHSDALSNY